MANRRIPEERQAAYYIGMGLTGLGILLCFGSIASGGCSVSGGGFPSPGSIFGPFIFGMILTVVGSLLRSVGARGLAGSGVILDPEQARRDVEPWSRMGGGMIKDALDEADIDLSGHDHESKRAAEPDFDEKLRKLHKLHEDGIISREEYEQEKREILDQL